MAITGRSVAQRVGAERTVIVSVTDHLALKSNGTNAVRFLI
jgi:hypothetical protein